MHLIDFILKRYVSGRGAVFVYHTVVKSLQRNVAGVKCKFR